MIDYGIGYRVRPSPVSSTVILMYINVQVNWLQRRHSGFRYFASVDSSPCCCAASSSEPLGKSRMKGLGVATCGKYEEHRSD